MPRFIRRRHRLRDGQNFLSDTVPTDYTFDRLASKLKEFRASTDKLRLVHSSTPMPTHWARQREAEHMRAVQERQQASAAAAAAGESAPKPTPETEVDEGKAPPEVAAAGAGRELQPADAGARAHGQGGGARGSRGAAGGRGRGGAVQPAAPAPLEHRLAMIYAFARHLHDDLRRQGDSVPIEMALTSEAFFSGKAHALHTASWYPHMRPLMTFKKCDERGRKLPGKATIPPMEFITGFDTLVRILDPKYYKDEPDDAAIGEDRRGKDDDDGVAVAAEVSQNDADLSEAAQSASCEGKGKEKMVAEEPSAQQQLQHPSQPDDLTTILPAKRPRNTPMMKALDPFFAHASLRVMLRPDDGHGTLEEQRAHIAALAAARDEETRASSSSAMGVRSLDEVGGDTAWMHKVRVLPDEVASGAAAGVSSSQVRRLVHDQGPLAAQGLVYPLVLDWLKRRELYRRPRPPKGTFADDGGLVEITAFGAWRKEDFCD
ncbi:cytidylyltransferase [Beauveria brongniartii RCEF 3172]|uniref:Cytidylyltransferase n=1 Tax=Beauveria brongniartii RCEF 3172 TaxID=1081107 RepID=A0A167K980_9HYPO|nr:cytidylyltransferase [Beauveria brongniartii RCEF 3172]